MSPDIWLIENGRTRAIIPGMWMRDRGGLAEVSGKKEQVGPFVADPEPTSESGFFGESSALEDLALLDVAVGNKSLENLGAILPTIGRHGLEQIAELAKIG